MADHVEAVIVTEPVAAPDIPENRVKDGSAVRRGIEPHPEDRFFVPAAPGQYFSHIAIPVVDPPDVRIEWITPKVIMSEVTVCNHIVRFDPAASLKLGVLFERHKTLTLPVASEM